MQDYDNTTPGAGAHNARILIYDGGMGTTLEDDFKADISNALWSSALLEDESKGHATLRALHGAFVNSGADLIQSCTYQCSFEGFKKQGYSNEQAVDLMRKAVSLAYEAINPSASTSSSGPSCSTTTTSNDNSNNNSTKGKERITRKNPAVVLALSCYGAILSPGQEYSGRYPPPYGHPSHSTSNNSTISSPGSSSSSTSSSALEASDKTRWMQEAENALEEWHYDRLKVFASHSETWDKISYIAFETLPVLYEARAIRRAMTRLRHTYRQHDHQSSSSHASSTQGQHKKEDINNPWPKWWISFVFPNEGNLPYTTSLESASLITAETIAETVFEPMRMAFSPTATQSQKEEVDVEIPTGLGVNCTKMRYLPRIVDSFTRSIASIPSDASQSKQMKQERWLILYPDGGLVYDPVTKTWHQDGGGDSTTFDTSPAEESAHSDSDSPAKVWAQQLVDIARKAEGGGGWDKIVLGGCCKASPAYISELANLVNAEKQQ